ncbi:unnamed protein product [Prorocentrum cordatum]|uniref:DUSP domain-containing protein n=1 Tax=Prorocentrum cordatum TaxID=2364126 RepID=A0ABN9SP14_9DINO|nr:unnamed protein product [Polarella glacialis]
MAPVKPSAGNGGAKRVPRFSSCQLRFLTASGKSGGRLAGAACAARGPLVGAACAIAGLPHRLGGSAPRSPSARHGCACAAQSARALRQEQRALHAFSFPGESRTASRPGRRSPPSGQPAGAGRGAGRSSSPAPRARAGEARRPGPIDNSALLQEGAGGRLRRGVDFECLPKDAWKRLMAVYRGGPEVARQAVRGAGGTCRSSSAAPAAGPRARRRVGLQRARPPPRRAEAPLSARAGDGRSWRGRRLAYGTWGTHAS